VAALIEDIQVEDPRTGIAAMGTPLAMDPLTQARYGDAGVPNRYASGANIGEAIKSRMPSLVKGAGMRGQGANQPLTNHADIMTRSAQAAVDLRPRPGRASAPSPPSCPSSTRAGSPSTGR